MLARQILNPRSGGLIKNFECGRHNTFRFSQPAGANRAACHLTSVRFQNGRQQSWHLGMLTDEEKYVGLEQERQPLDDMVEEHVDEEAVRGDDVEIDGETWQTFTDDDDDLALVQETPQVTTVLVGRVSQQTLEELLATLE